MHVGSEKRTSEKKYSIYIFVRRHSAINAARPLPCIYLGGYTHTDTHTYSLSHTLAYFFYMRIQKKRINRRVRNWQKGACSLHIIVHGCVCKVLRSTRKKEKRKTETQTKNAGLLESCSDRYIIFEQPKIRTGTSLTRNMLHLHEPIFDECLHLSNNLQGSVMPRNTPRDY